MYKPTDPLVFPPGFPPTNRREKFFIGVRWLGSDLSFFKKLKQQQAERTQEQMDVWGSGRRREVAEQLARGFRKEVRWPSPVFLPTDSFSVMCNGPSFGIIDDLGSVAVIKQFEKAYDIRVSNAFWGSLEHTTFGEVVDALIGLIPPGPEYEKGPARP
jgi:hypothetical protein